MICPEVRWSWKNIVCVRRKSRENDLTWSQAIMKEHQVMLITRKFIFWLWNFRRKREFRENWANLKSGAHLKTSSDVHYQKMLIFCLQIFARNESSAKIELTWTQALISKHYVMFIDRKFWFSVYKIFARNESSAKIELTWSQAHLKNIKGCSLPENSFLCIEISYRTEIP